MNWACLFIHRLFSINIQFPSADSTSLRSKTAFPRMDGNPWMQRANCVHWSLIYTILTKRLEHLWVSLSVGFSGTNLSWIRGITIVKIWGNQKLYADFQLCGSCSLYIINFGIIFPWKISWNFGYCNLNGIYLGHPNSNMEKSDHLMSLLKKRTRGYLKFWPRQNSSFLP